MRFRPTTLCLLTLLASASCTKPTQPPSPPPPPPPSPLVALSEGTFVEVPPGRQLWVTDTAIEETTDTGARHAIVPLIAGRVPAAEKRDGQENSFLIPRLQAALSAWPGAAPHPPLALAALPSVPYRTLTEVIYTSGQADRAAQRLLVRAEGRDRALTITIPAPADLPEQLLIGTLGAELAGALGGTLEGTVTGTPTGTLTGQALPAAPPSPALNLSVTLTAEGIVVAGSGGKLAPGCEHTATGRVITVPMRAGAQDLAGLSACLRRIKAMPDFGGETSAILGADPERPFGEVAGAIAATQGTAAAPLFPVTMLSAGVR